MSDIQLARVRIREFGPIELFHITENQVAIGDWCIVNFDRGEDYGKVLALESLEECDISQKQHVVRICLTADTKRIEQNKKNAQATIPGCQEEIKSHTLEMKVIQAEYTFDKSKIVFYFAAAERVDFRKLVRDLAKKLKIRIELHQVGIRDETKIIGGIGCCGRTTCCKSWIHEFHPVNIRMAKLQQIQLHPSKLSGVCGRLKCCLAYEYKLYRELDQNLPKKGQRVRTPQGTGDVLDCCLLSQSVTVKTDDNVVNTFSGDKVTAVSRSKARAKVKAQKRRVKQRVGGTAGTAGKPSGSGGGQRRRSNKPPGKKPE